MTRKQSLIAPVAGLSVVAGSIAAFGAAFGILVGFGLAITTIAATRLMLGAGPGIGTGHRSSAALAPRLTWPGF